MNQNLSSYRIFYTVANTGNISKAAKELYISQPAISKSIQKLEESVGCKLFSRSSRGVVLTDEGKLLYEHVSEAFETLTMGEEKLKRSIELGVGHLKIGVSSTLCKYLLLPYLKEFIRQNPHISISISCQSTNDTLKLLEDNKIDIGLIGKPENLKNIHFDFLEEIEDIFVAAKDYLRNLKARGIQKDHILQSSTLMLLDKNNMTRQYIDDYLQENKILYTLSPDFSMYDYYVGLNHSKIEKYETNQDGSFDVEAFISNGKDKNVDMVLFSNPNNPTGHSITLSEMKKISEAFKDIPVIFDEAYMEFGKESAVCLLKEYPNVFVCRTLSKAYGLAGIRCGFMISSQVEKLSALFITYALSSVTQTIASVVLRHADEYKDTIATIISERERMYQEVKEFKQLTMYPSNANFLFGRSEKKDLLLAMFKEKNITIRNYEDASFRITIGTKEENEMVLDVLRRFEYANS